MKGRLFGHGQSELVGKQGWRKTRKEGNLFSPASFCGGVFCFVFFLVGFPYVLHLQHHSYAVFLII